MSISMTPGGVAGRIRHLEETEGNASDVNISQGERIACAIAGTAMVAAGLKKQGAAGLALALIGGGLAYRAFTGHCDLRRRSAPPPRASGGRGPAATCTRG